MRRVVLPPGSERGGLMTMASVLKLTANGYTSEEIARLLKLSVHTANQYLTNTAQKLNAVNRTEVAYLAHLQLDQAPEQI